MSERPRVVIVQNSAGSDAGRLLDWLADEDIDTVVIAGRDLPPTTTYPARPTDGSAAVAVADGLVLLGGGFMPDDDAGHPFLQRERTLVADAIETGTPVLGICLGAQVLALVAGGEVTATSGETERGSCGIDLLPGADDDPLFAGLTVHGELRMIENHQDSITTLPPDSVHLATSDGCRVQAFRVGAAAWGVQFHPEAAHTRIADWDESKLAAEGFDRAALLAEANADAAVNAEQARALVTAFAGVVRKARR